MSIIRHGTDDSGLLLAHTAEGSRLMSIILDVTRDRRRWRAGDLGRADR